MFYYSILGLASLTNGAGQPHVTISAGLQQPLVAVVSSHSDGRQMQQNVYLTTAGSISTSPSGGTIYHHGQSPVRGTPPLSNLQQNIIGMNVSQQSQISQKRPGSVASTTTAASPISSRLVLDSRQMTVGTMASTTRNISGGPPKKKIKLEEKPPATPEIAHQRKILLEHKRKEMQEIKENYVEHLTELFFLQSGRNVMDYLPWKKRPTPQLVAFLKSENLDSDEEEEHLQEKRINDEVFVACYSQCGFVNFFQICILWIALNVKPQNNCCMHFLVKRNYACVFLYTAVHYLQSNCFHDFCFSPFCYKQNEYVVMLSLSWKIFCLWE